MSPTLEFSQGCSKPVIESLEQLIVELYKVFESDHVNVDYVQSLMEAYKSNPADWRKFAKFDQYRYTRNLVDSGNGKFNLMILCWGEGHGSAIHDHSDAHCFMKMLSGSLSEVRFAWPENDNEGDNINRVDGMKEMSRTRLEEDSVCYINDSLGLHRVENSSHVEPAVSLHLYCPPFSSCNMFDQRTGRKTKCNVTFWSKFGARTSYDNESVSATVPCIPLNN